MFILFISLSDKVPSTGPVAKAENIGVHTVSIIWKEIPKTQRNGFISNYTIFYQAEDGKQFCKCAYSQVKKKPPEPQIDAMDRPAIGVSPMVRVLQPCTSHLASLSLSENGTKSTCLLSFLESNESEVTVPESPVGTGGVDIICQSVNRFAFWELADHYARVGHAWIKEWSGDRPIWWHSPQCRTGTYTVIPTAHC